MMSVQPPPRRLAVWLDARQVGELREQGNLWAFRYGPAWRDTGFDLSPTLPRAAGEIVDGASLRPVQWFFDNLLPEEGSRQLLAQGANLDPADAFGLLQSFGPESAGALTLLAPGRSLPDPDLAPLPDQALSARIRALPRLPLSEGAPKRMSLAGAQHKLAVVLHRTALGAGGQRGPPHTSSPTTNAWTITPTAPPTNGSACAWPPLRAAGAGVELRRVRNRCTWSAASIARGKAWAHVACTRSTPARRSRWMRCSSTARPPRRGWLNWCRYAVDRPPPVSPCCAGSCSTS